MYDCSTGDLETHALRYNSWGRGRVAYCWLAGMGRGERCMSSTSRVMESKAAAIRDAAPSTCCR